MRENYVEPSVPWPRTCNVPLICCCGGIHREHRIGDENCFREAVINPPVKLCNDWWNVEGSDITGYTLREQRLYHQHECGCWSRPKGGGSVNSIEMDD